MTDIDSLIEIGFSSGMNASSLVLDLCCGYHRLTRVHTPAGDQKGGWRRSRQWLGDSPGTITRPYLPPLFCFDSRFVEVDRPGKRAAGKAEETAGLSSGNEDNAVSSLLYADQPCFPLLRDGFS